MPKFFPPHFRAIAQALHLIFIEGQYADRVVSKVLKQDKRRGSQDRAFIAENTYNVVRNYRRLSYLAGDEPRGPEDWWRLVGIQLMLQGKMLPKWQEFSRLNPKTIERRLETARKKRAIWESIPDWMDERCHKELGNAWPNYLSALNNQAPIFLRVNRLKTNAKDLSEKLAKEGAITKVIGEETLLVKERKNLFSTVPFKSGLFEVQDLHSQRVARALDLEPGQTFIDACAGAGGKTLHAASLMGNKGQIIALDTEDWKLKDLRKRARRAGVQNIEARPITSTKVIKRLKGRADRLLLDVPCSGMGVLRRNPDVKWKMTEEFVERLRLTQTEIINSYSRMLKPGGLMVYATCSILPSENREQVDKFLASTEGQEFSLIEDESLAPQAKGGDGFYLARLRKAVKPQSNEGKPAEVQKKKKPAKETATVAAKKTNEKPAKAAPKKEKVTPKAKTKIAPSKAAPTKKVATTKAVKPKKGDDLKQIKGIGPKMEGLLNEAGIHTFSQLGRASKKKLGEVLEVAGPRFKSAKVEDWQAAAKLAAADKKKS